MFKQIMPLSKFIDTIDNKVSELNYRVTVLISQFIPKRVGIISCIINQAYVFVHSLFLKGM